MSPSIIKINNYAGVLGTTPPKQMAYVTYGLGLALSYLYLTLISVFSNQ